MIDPLYYSRRDKFGMIGIINEHQLTSYQVEDKYCSLISKN